MREAYERLIGRVEGKLDRLIDDRVESAKVFAQFYQEIELIKHKQDYISEKIEAVTQRLAQAEKPLAELSLRRERLAGAFMVASFLFAAAGGSAALFGQKLIAALKLWL